MSFDNHRSWCYTCPTFSVHRLDQSGLGSSLIAGDGDLQLLCHGRLGGRKEGREGRQADNNDDDRCGIKTGWWEGLGMRLHKIYCNFMEIRPDSSEHSF